MCTKKNITWLITDNSVKSRMIDNSLIHTFVSSQKIQKRTKLLNAQLRKYGGVKDYKQYIELKTNILRHFEDNSDTDDPGYLTDVDYNIIYSSDSTRAKYVAEHTKKYNFTSDVIYKKHKSNNTKNTKRKKKNKSKNTKESSGTKHNASNKHINIGWQKVVRQRDVSPLFDGTSANSSNNEENTFEGKNSLQSNNEFFSQRLASQSSTLSNTKKSVKKKTRKNNRVTNVTINKLHSEDNLSSVTEITSENKVQNYKHQNILLNDSNSELDSLSSHYDATPSKSTEKINDSNSELNYITQNSQDSIASISKIEVFNENKEQICEHQDVALKELNTEFESQSLSRKITPSKFTEKNNDFNNEEDSVTPNFEDGISSEIEVFDESKEQIYGHEDVALKELNTEFESQSSPRKITPSKFTEKINDFNNEVDSVAPNFEDGISSKIEVFDESKEQIYGHQDAALKESNAEFELQSSHSKVTPSKSTEKENDLNNEVNSVTLNPKDGILSDKIEVFDESKVEIDEHQDTTLNESNAELDTRSPHYKTTLSKSRENISDTSLITLEENNSDTLTQANNKNPINTDNCNSRTSYKSKLLKNVRRNLTSVLEEVNFTNNEKNINTDKNRKSGLNQLSTVISSKRSTPLKKRRIDVHELCNSPPDTLSLDQQKDSGFDDDSQDKFVKIEKSDIKSPSRNTVKKILGSPEYPKRIADIPDTTDMEDSKEDVSDTHLENYDNYLREPNNKEVTESDEKETKNASSNKDEELSTINQEDKTHSVKVKKSCKVKKQHSLSPKQNRTKLDADSKSNGCILKKQDNRKVKQLLKEEEIKNFQYDQDDKDAEISINQKDKMHFVNKEDLPDTKEKQLLSPKQGCLKDAHSKFDNNVIVEEQSSKHKETKESFGEEEVKNSPELNRVHKDTKISTQEDKMHVVKSESDIKKSSLLSPKKECKKNEQSKSYTNILDERDNKEIMEKEVKDFYQSSEIDKDKISSINKDETHTKLKDECDTKKLQLPKITSTEIINTKYKMINKKSNDINSNDINIEKVDNINATSEHTPADNNASINCSSVDWQDKTTDVEEINNISMMEETDNEEENTCTYMSPQNQKRLQQKRLNLVIYDSSESDSEAKDIAETSRKSIDNSDSHSDASCSSKNDTFNDETDHAREKINADISSGEDIRVRSERASIFAEYTMKQNATSMKKEIKKKSDEAALSAANKGPLRETRCSENVNGNGDERNEHVGDIERSSLIDPPNTRENSLSGFSLRISDSNDSYNNDDSNGFSRDFRSSSLNKETACNEAYQSEHSVCTDNLETSSKPVFDISCGRPYNLQQLVEDQKLLVEALPASFTLADISDDDEAFILNIPNKVLQYNLQDELFRIKGDTVKFGKNKYKIVRKKVGTTSCVFATGKKRKPYKIVNINEISTVTVRERLPPYAEKSDILASHSNVTSAKSKSSKINNQQTAKRDSKILEVSGHKRKRCTSDFEVKQYAVKKKRSKNCLQEF